jgi:hypothetical protein
VPRERVGGDCNLLPLAGIVYAEILRNLRLTCHGEIARQRYQVGRLVEGKEGMMAWPHAYSLHIEPDVSTR